MDELSERTRSRSRAPARIERFLSQPFFRGPGFHRPPGVFVDLAGTSRASRACAKANTIICRRTPFLHVGTIEQAVGEGQEARRGSGRTLPEQRPEPWPPLRFDLVSPEKLLFAGDVGQVDLPGSEGDLASRRACALVTALAAWIITSTREGGDLRIVVNGGFAEVGAGRGPCWPTRPFRFEAFDRAVLARRDQGYRGRILRTRPKAAARQAGEPPRSITALQAALAALELQPPNDPALSKPAEIAGISVGACPVPRRL